MKALVLATLMASAILACQHEVTMSWMLSASRESSWPPVYADGTIYAVQTGSSVSALNEATGAVTWSVNDAGVVSGALLTGGNVIVGKTGSIVALSAADGSVVAQFALSSATEIPCGDGAPIAANGVVYFGTTAGKVYALDATTLNSIWTADLGATNGVSAPVSMWGSFVIAGTFSGNVFLIGSDGSVARSYTTPDVPEFDATNGVIYGIQTGILINGNVAYFGTNTDANLVALNLRSMSSTWSTTLSTGSYSFSTAILGSDGMLYTTTHDGRLFAVDPSAGVVQWSLDLGERVSVRGPLSLIDGAVVVTTSSGSIAGIQTDTHDMDFWFAFGAAGSPSSSVVPTTGLRLVVSGSTMIYPLALACRA